LETSGPPPWTLSARLDGGVLEFALGDGRRLALRARQPAALLGQSRRAMPAADLLGAELATRLAAGDPRVLNLQLDEALDALAWESLQLGASGGSCLGERFVVARQLMCDADPAPVPAAALAESLAVALIHASTPRACPQALPVALDALDEPSSRKAVTEAQVLLLDGVPLAHLLARVSLPRRERLLVTLGPAAAGASSTLTAAIDQGAAVLSLAPTGHLTGDAAGDPRGDPLDEPLQGLLHQIGGGAGVGEAARRLHQRAAPAPFEARLYGDAAMRFVRSQAPASRRQVTSLSFDLVGSTTVMQQLGDEAYAEMLASLHARCTHIVRRHGGQPDDPQGDDGVMSYFGHPSAIEDAAVHAVEAGLQIVRTVSELGVSVRVGIATGVVAVHAGQPVGLSIHLAARLQQAAPAGTVLVAEGTRQLVAHAFELKELAERPDLKGIDDPGRLHRVTGPSRDAKLHRLERLSRLTPLVGREAELERLHAGWQLIRRGECRLLLVRAEAGMGKSRLVREFRGQLVQGGVKVLECRCRPDASASPYLALAEALKRWLGIGAGDADAPALQKLAAALPSTWRDGEPLAMLAALLGLAPQPPQPSPGRARQRMLAILLDWFELFARDRACCLIVEDWHWVDPSMREFVDHLVQRRGGPGLVLVVTMRSEVGLVPPRGHCFDRIELAGLVPEAARELVRRACEDAPLPASLVHALAARGDGVPLFLEEATRMARELDTERLAAHAAALETVPASLQDLLMARLDSIGDARTVAQVAAVLGREFSLAQLAALTESGRFALDAGSLAEQLAVLDASGLVRTEGEDLYAFKHALVRDAAYASLWARDRHALHAQMVQLLQQRWPELAARRPELLAHHQTEAGLHAEALAQWELAASNASARSAELEAISHLRRALALLARSDAGPERDRTALRLQLMLAARLLATEGYGAESVSRAYVEAGRLCDALGDETGRFKVEMGLEAYRFMRADFGPALEHGRRAAAIAAQSGDIKQRLHAHWGLACTLFHQGELCATMREMETGLSLYSPALHRLFGVQDPGIMCLAYSSWGLWERARPDAAVARIDHAIAIATEFEHKFSQAVALAYGASIHLLRGEPQPAQARAEACIRVCEEAGFPVWLAIARCMRGRLLCGHGDFDAGLAEMRAGHALWLSTGSMVSQPLYLALQAEGLMLAGEPEAAVACVDQGLAIAERYGERQLEAELRRLRGELALQRGEGTELAETWLKSGHALALRQHRLGFALRSATSLARCWAAQGRQRRARRLLVPLLARWSEGRDTHDLRAALALCDTLAP